MIGIFSTPPPMPPTVDMPTSTMMQIQPKCEVIDTDHLICHYWEEIDMYTLQIFITLPIESAFLINNMALLVTYAAT